MQKIVSSVTYKYIKLLNLFIFFIYESINTSEVNLELQYHAVQDLPDNVTSFSDIASTYIDRPSNINNIADLSCYTLTSSDIPSTYIDRPGNRNNVVPPTGAAYENVQCDFCEDSVHDIDIVEEEDACSEAYYSQPAIHTNIPRNTNEKAWYMSMTY